ncbi:MAG TPA: aminodeoxychorismate/anthranilate synthase component II [Staphylococcus sp.]|nr:aminodeoxychorismate/anthranilate synthase component II [Staphylococcus sp.]
MILIIDNKDSFTYNIVDYIKRGFEGEVRVVDVENISIQKVNQILPDAIVISPGPGSPDDYPVLNEVLKVFFKRVPILGVCLGFQQIINYFGGDIIKGIKPIHGHTTQIHHNGKGIFKDLPKSFNVMRYHSLIADHNTFPNALEITASNATGVIMACAHKIFPVYGVQYHPESMLSEYGIEQVKLFIEIVEASHANTI